MNVKPIQTIYNGYRFRSRAEARWAVFFDTCKIKYMYEPEGLVLSDGTRYLPDFYLPESKTYFEVKGLMNEVDMHKIEQLQEDLSVPVVIGYSDMTFQASSNFSCEVPIFRITCKGNSMFCKCAKCNKFFFIGDEGAWSCINCGYYDGDAGFDYICNGDLESGFYRKELNPDPFEAAKQARFEHGEMGR